MTSQTKTGEMGGKKRSSGVGVVRMIESFPARSEACQNSIRAPQDPLERVVCGKGVN